MKKQDPKWGCDNCLMEEDKPTKLVQPNSKLRAIVLAAIVLLALGFFIDLFSGFHILRQARNMYAGVAGLLIVAVAYFAAEAGSEWIGGKDKVTDPLYKRALRLLLLLVFGAFILAALWYVLKQIGIRL